MPPHEPMIAFTAKEIHIMVQALELAIETGALSVYGKPSEIERIREKLNSRR